MSMLGFVKFMIGQYDECRRLNERVLKSDPANAYAHKGLGLSLAKMGKVEEGIEHLRKSIELAVSDKGDYYHDLAWALAECGRGAEAVEVLKECEAETGSLEPKSSELLDMLVDER
jgi:tetratricopeptide (TPR) repeat protein